MENTVIFLFFVCIFAEISKRMITASKLKQIVRTLHIRRVCGKYITIIQDDYTGQMIDAGYHQRVIKSVFVLNAWVLPYPICEIYVNPRKSELYLMIRLYEELLRTRKERCDLEKVLNQAILTSYILGKILKLDKIMVCCQAINPSMPTRNLHHQHIIMDNRYDVCAFRCILWRIEKMAEETYLVSFRHKQSKKTHANVQ